MTIFLLAFWVGEENANPAWEKTAREKNRSGGPWNGSNRTASELRLPFLRSSAVGRRSQGLSCSQGSDRFRIFRASLDDLYGRFPLDDLDLSRQIDIFLILNDLAHVRGWDRYNLHDLA